MATTGQVYPTSAVTSAESPWLDEDWATPGNVTSDDGNTANITGPQYDNGDQSYVLKAQGFDFSAIPDGATIVGVTARINAWYSAGGGSLDLAQLLNTSGAKVGTNLCVTPVTLTTSDTTVITRGGAANLWGNALTAAWVKDPDFGIALGIQATANNADVFLDYVTLEIEYTPPAPPPTFAFDTEAVFPANNSHLPPIYAGGNYYVLALNGGDRKQFGIFKTATPTVPASWTMVDTDLFHETQIIESMSWKVDGDGGIHIIGQSPGPVGSTAYWAFNSSTDTLSAKELIVHVPVHDTGQAGSDIEYFEDEFASPDLHMVHTNDASFESGYAVEYLRRVEDAWGNEFFPSGTSQVAKGARIVKNPAATLLRVFWCDKTNYNGVVYNEANTGYSWTGTLDRSAPNLGTYLHELSNAIGFTQPSDDTGVAYIDTSSGISFVGCSLAAEPITSATPKVNSQTISVSISVDASGYLHCVFVKNDGSIVHHDRLSGSWSGATELQSSAASADMVHAAWLNSKVGYVWDDGLGGLAYAEFVPGGDQSKSGSDSTTSIIETATVTNTTAVSDTATGTESPYLTADYLSSDTAIATDTASVEAIESRSDSDSAIGTESLAVQASITNSDFATGDEDSDLDYGYFGDIATGTETASVEVGAESRSDSDSAVGSESASIAGAITDYDAATGTEESHLDYGEFGDLAIGSETASVEQTNAITETDQATGNEAVELTVDQTSSDTATGTEGWIVDGSDAKQGNDSATGVESVDLSSVYTDSAVGNDESLIEYDDLGELGVGTDSHTLDITGDTENKSDADTGQGTETASLAAQLASTDQAAGSDTATVQTEDGKQGTDSASGTEALTLEAISAAQDSALAGEQSLLDVSLPTVDSGTATDAAIVQTEDIKVISESGTATEQVTDLNREVGESGAAIEQSTVEATLPVAGDAATGSDTATVQTADGRADSDSATGTESAWVEVSLTVSDIAESIEVHTDGDRASADSATADEQVVLVVEIPTVSDSGSAFEYAFISLPRAWKELGTSTGATGVAGDTDSGEALEGDSALINTIEGGATASRMEGG